MNQNEVNNLTDTVRSLNAQIAALTEKYPDIRIETNLDIGSKGTPIVRVEASKVITTAV